MAPRPRPAAPLALSIIVASVIAAPLGPPKEPPPPTIVHEPDRASPVPTRADADDKPRRPLASVKPIDGIAWTPLFRGVGHARLTFGVDGGPSLLSGEPGPVVVDVLRVDLKAEGIEFIATPGNGDEPLETNGQTTVGFLQEFGLVAAINTHFFSPCCSAEVGQPKDLVGLAIAATDLVSESMTESPRARDTLLLGAAWDRPGESASWPIGPHIIPLTFGIRVDPIIALAGERLFELTPYAAAEYPPESPLGERWAIEDTFAMRRHPRTLIGYAGLHPLGVHGPPPEVGTIAFLVTIDGRQPGRSLGATLPEAAGIMRAIGCEAAMNLDGGGSTTMVVRGPDGEPKLLNRPSGGQPRVVGSNLGLRALPLLETPDE